MSEISPEKIQTFAKFLGWHILPASGQVFCADSSRSKLTQDPERLLHIFAPVVMSQSRECFVAARVRVKASVVRRTDILASPLTEDG
jgi:hypothetical protein